MTKRERVRYLANLLVVAASDGAVSSSEDAFIESTRKAIKAKKAELKEAQNDATQAVVDVKSFLQLSVAVQNVEDIAVLLLNGGTADIETHQILSDAVQSLELGEHASQMLLLGARARYESEAGICPACGTGNAPQAKFCSSCGNSLDRSGIEAGQGVATDISPVSHGITVTFAESSAAGYADALAAAKANSSFQEYRKGSKLWFAASFSVDQRAELLILVKNLKGMRNRKVYIDGAQRQWDAVFRFTYCAVRREAAFRPTEFCFGEEDYNQNCWGCSQLNLPWSDWAEWFSWGRFIDEKTFEFDMPRIEHELRRQKQSVDLCPYFRENFFEQVLRNFPKRVVVGPEDDWDYEESYGRGQATFQVRVLVDYGDGDTEVETREVSGVKPKGRRPALELMKVAANAAGVPIDDLPSR